MQTDPNWSNFFYDPQLHKVSPSTCCSATTTAGFHQLFIPHSQSWMSSYWDFLRFLSLSYGQVGQCSLSLCHLSSLDLGRRAGLLAGYLSLTLDPVTATSLASGSVLKLVSGILQLAMLTKAHLSQGLSSWMVLSCAVLKIKVAIADVLLVGLATCLCPGGHMELLVYPWGLCWKVLGRGLCCSLPTQKAWVELAAEQVWQCEHWPGHVSSAIYWHQHLCATGRE